MIIPIKNLTWFQSYLKDRDNGEYEFETHKMDPVS
jgi:hypothetical protein